MVPESRHECLIYHGAPSVQLPALAALIKQKLDDGYRCLYLNSLPMVSGMRSSLAALGFDVMDEVATGRLVLSSESLLDTEGTFDVSHMIHKLEDALDQTLNDGYRGLWASGDMTWEFGNKKNLEKLLDYEWQLEELISQRQELCGVCQYHRDTLPDEAMRQGLQCHPTIFINETLSLMNPHYLKSKVDTDQTQDNTELDAAIIRLCHTQNIDLMERKTEIF